MKAFYHVFFRIINIWTVVLTAPVSYSKTNVSYIVSVFLRSLNVKTLPWRLARN